jgi:hypothetical protein
MAVKLFVSWSGETSRCVAETFREWIPKVLQSVNPWVSSKDIPKGRRWSEYLAKEIGEAKVGVVCVTAENIREPWLLFEAGALAKTLEETYVCPYLFDLEPGEIDGPLAQFQLTTAEKEDTRKLILTVNRGLGDQSLPEKLVESSFEKWWPDLESELQTIEQSFPRYRERTDRELLEQILHELRVLPRLINEKPIYS